MSGREDIPVVMVHDGDSWYLPYALYQARGVAGDQRVVLLGNGRRSWPGIDQIPLSSIESSAGISRFRASYIHRSTNSERFELFCWLRWFVLLEYMMQSKLEEIVYLDSDVLLYSPPREWVSSHFNRSQGCSYFIPRQDAGSFLWCASAHVSYWTREALQLFCDFAENSYTDHACTFDYEQKWKWHLENQTPGGVCDMNGLYRFWRLHPEIVVNLGEGTARGVVDRAMGTPDNLVASEYAMNGGVKRVMYVGHNACLVTASEGASVNALALHFQGWTKDLMPFYYRGRGFQGKTQRDVRSLWRFLQVRLAWRLRRIGRLKPDA